MNVTEGSASVCIMGRTQRVFNCGEAQLSILTDVYPTITIESQQKASHSPGCACAHHENTRMEDTGRFTLVISLNAHTDSIACATKRTNMSALLLSCHVVGRPYSLYFCADYRRVMLRDSSLCPFSK